MYAHLRLLTLLYHPEAPLKGPQWTLVENHCPTPSNPQSVAQPDTDSPSYHLQDFPFHGFHLNFRDFIPEVNKTNVQLSKPSTMQIPLSPYRCTPDKWEDHLFTMPFFHSLGISKNQARSCSASQSLTGALLNGFRQCGRVIFHYVILTQHILAASH